MILTSSLTTDRWFQIFTDKSCFVLDFLTDKVLLGNPVCNSAFFLTADRWFQILSGKSCFDLIILTDNWQMIPNLNWQVLFWPQHPYWQLTDNSKFNWQNIFWSISTFLYTHDNWQMNSSFFALIRISHRNIDWHLIRPFIFHLLHPYWDVMSTILLQSSSDNLYLRRKLKKVRGIESWEQVTINKEKTVINV